MKNSAFKTSTEKYYTQEKEFLYHLIPEGPNAILDCGCASGRLGKRLLELNKASEVIGIELFEPAAREATGVYKRVHIGDIEEMDFDYTEYFDLVICGDILEHLKEPTKVLEKIHRMLKAQGLIICCLPNLRYWRVLRDLVFRGDFEYRNEGIMDQTHLRFFTTRSFKRLLEQAAFQVEYSSMKIPDGGKQEILNRLTGGFFKEFLGLQIIMSGRKP